MMGFYHSALSYTHYCNISNPTANTNAHKIIEESTEKNVCILDQEQANAIAFL